jgi:hypothetical protein
LIKATAIITACCNDRNALQGNYGFYCRREPRKVIREEEAVMPVAKQPAVTWPGACKTMAAIIARRWCASR